MSIPRDILCREIETRIENTKQAMGERGYDALIVYGDNKVYGSLQYLTDYIPTRSGWTSLSPTETYIFEGAAVLISVRGEPTLLIDRGERLRKEICTRNVSAGGIGPKKEGGLTGKNMAGILEGWGATGRVGIESWDVFPIPLYLELKEFLSGAELERSTVVEELRLIKSPLEIEIIRKAAAVGDRGHQAIVDSLRDGVGKTELEVIRAAEHAMRSADPVYEDSCTSSPSVIYSGATGLPGATPLWHLPSGEKRIQKGDVVLWDICSRYEGYAIDTARARVVGKATDLQKKAFEVNLQMHQAVIEAAKPGVKAHDLVEIADKAARGTGLEFWHSFLGHGIGLECHERPDMGIEETELAANMVITVEPRVAFGDLILGLEDMVLVAETGGESLTQFPRTPLEL